MRKLFKEIVLMIIMVLMFLIFFAGTKNRCVFYIEIMTHVYENHFSSIKFFFTVFFDTVVMLIGIVGIVFFALKAIYHAINMYLILYCHDKTLGISFNPMFNIIVDEDCIKNIQHIHKKPKEESQQETVNEQ